MPDDDEQRIERAMGVFSQSPMQAVSSSLRAPEAGALAPAVAPSTPSCRPWDRGDLYRRMATYSSLNWFGKPNVAGPLACARRGWVTVDIDLIACEICESRLSFQVPSGWKKQQAEEAALVFSESLDGGHKPGCPWKGNACAEELVAVADPAPALIQAYDERLQALIQLPALPVISSAAFDHLKLTREAQAKMMFAPQENEFTRNLDGAEGEAVQKLREQYNAFCQAQKLISLCGWEVRILPYSVEPNDSKVVKVSVPGKPKAPSSFDATSIVLECPICKSSVGLWGLKMLSRSVLSLATVLATIQASERKEPVEEPRSAEIPEENPSTSGSKSPVEPAGLDLSLTIAGGPRPTRLLYTSPASVPYPGHFNQLEVPEPEPEPEPAPVAESRGKRKLSEEHEEPGLKRTKTGESPETSGGKRESEMIQARTQQIAKESLGDNKPPTEFDPIHRHRHFCPWIFTHPSGWQLTLEALCSLQAGGSNGGSNNDASERPGVTRKIDALASVRKMLGGEGKGKTVAAPV